MGPGQQTGCINSCRRWSVQGVSATIINVIITTPRVIITHPKGKPQLTARTWALVSQRLHHKLSVLVQNRCINTIISSVTTITIQPHVKRNLLLGYRPWSSNSCITSCRRWSKMRRVEKVPGELGVLGVIGEFKSPSPKSAAQRRKVTNISEIP